MYRPNQLTTFLSPRTSLSRSSSPPASILIALTLTMASFAFSATARAVIPPPGGGYPGGNTALGDDALFNLTTGIENTAIGSDALFNVTTGIFNTATGEDALFANTTGFNNTANGWHALETNTTGGTNTAIGCDALDTNAAGSNNIALGFRAGALITGDNNIEIGNSGVSGESNRIRIGTRSTHKNTFIAGIFGAAVPTGVGVVIDNTGRLGTTTSSERFKDAIKPMDNASEAILSLKPVTFRYKHELDPDGIRQFGLVAEQVEKVNPDLVARDEQGKPYTVRYEAVNAMLLNEFLKEHRKVEDLGREDQEQSRKMQTQDSKIEGLVTTIAEQQKEIAALTASLKAQASQIQKVNDQLEGGKSAPRVVINDQ